MWKVTITGLLARKRRLIGTMLAILLGVGFISGVYVLSDTIRRTFDDLFTSVYKGTDAVVTGKGGLENGFRPAPSRLPRSVVDEVRAVPGVASAVGFVQAYSQVVDTKGVALGGTNTPTYGAAWSDDPRVNPFTISDGSAPATDDQIVLDKNTARIGKLAIGQTVTVLSLADPKPYTIVGFTSFGTADSPAGASYLHYTPAEADRALKTNGDVDQIQVVAQPGVSQDQLKTALVAGVKHGGVEIFTGAEATAKRQNDIQKNLRGFTTFLLVFAVVSLFVGSFIIFNTFQILVAQRRQELALLRAIGASGRQVMASVVLEALVIGVVAGLLGVLAGILLAQGLEALFAVIGFQLPAGGLVLRSRTVVTGLSAGTVVTVLAALLPAWRAARTPPVAAMQAAAVERRGRSVVRLVLGFATVAVSVLLVVRGLTSHDPGNGPVFSTGSAAGVAVLALALLGPWLIVPFTRLVGPALRRRGTQGQLAQENVVRSPRRNALTALSLTVGLALVGLIMVFAASFSAQITTTIDGQFKGDFFVAPKNQLGVLSPNVAKAVRAVPDVVAATAVRFYFNSRYVDARGKEDDAGILFADMTTIEQTVDIPVSAGRLSDVKVGTIAMSAREAKQRQLGIGDTVNVRFVTAAVPLRVVALIDGEKVAGLFQGATGLVDLSTYDANFASSVDALVYVRTRDRNDVAGTKKRLEAAVAAYPTARVSDLASYKTLVKGQLAPFLRFIFALLGVSVVIAGIGVANTLKLSVTERTRELGLLRAVGMSRGQARSMVRWESVVISVFGALTGLGVGTGFGVAIMRALRTQGFTQIVVPLGPLALVTLGAAALGVVAAWGAARRVSRLDVLASIAHE